MTDLLVPAQEVGVLGMERLVDVFLNNQVSPKTRQAYAYDLKKWFTWLGGFEIVPNVEDSVNFRLYLEENHSPRTAARIFNTCRVFYRFLGGFNPFQAIKSPRTTKNRTPKVPDDGIVTKMMEICSDDRDFFILALLLNGLRRQEVASLQSDAIQWSPMYGKDIIKVVGKGMKERLVPATLDVSKAYRKHRTNNEWMFTDGSGHISVRVVEWVVEKWSKAAGKAVSPHQLRHHYATRLVRAKAPILTVSKLLGHESVATTQIYVSLDLQSMVEAADLDQMDRKVIEG